MHPYSSIDTTAAWKKLRFILSVRSDFHMIESRSIAVHDGNYTRILGAILNKSRRQHPTRHQLYGQLPPITKIIQVRRTRHAGHCWRSRDELINDVLLWTPTYGRAKAGRPARTYIQQLCEDTGCSPEDLPEAMNDREKCRERVRDIRASGTTRWWWWWWYPSHSANGSSNLLNMIPQSIMLTIAPLEHPGGFGIKQATMVDMP